MCALPFSSEATVTSIFQSNTIDDKIYFKDSATRDRLCKKFEGGLMGHMWQLQGKLSTSPKKMFI
jgi:hypothetical protein